MAALITVYTTPSTYQAAKLTTYTDMADALNYLKGIGYTGSMQVDSTGTWIMWFQSASQNAASTAKIGDWIVIKNGAIATSVPAAQATSLYTTTPPA